MNELNPATLSSSYTQPSCLGKKKSIDKWQLKATRPTSQPSKKTEITSLDQFWPTTSRARLPTLCSWCSKEEVPSLPARIQKNETLNTTTTHVHCTKSIGCTAQQFVRETLQASHPPKKKLHFHRQDFAQTPSVHVRQCLCEGYDDCQHERQHNRRACISFRGVCQGTNNVWGEGASTDCNLILMGPSLLSPRKKACTCNGNLILRGSSKKTPVTVTGI